jgi:RNA polymerase sigma-70 factor (ECF subfamily)
MRRRKDQQRTDEIDGLYRELYPSLVRFSQGIVGSRSDAEDAVHDAFVAAVRNEPADDPRPWLFRVTRNASIDLIRRRRPTVPIEAVEAGLPAISSGPQTSAELTEQLELMRAGLDALPERGRTAILLRELGGLPYSEIGQVLDTTEGNVKVLIFRARASLHELTEATELDCESVRMTLSAAADGEARVADRTRAKLHAAHCHACRSFTSAIGSQRVAIVALVPLFGAPHALGMAGGGGVVGGGITGVKAAVAGMLAVATVGVSAGGVAVLNQSHAHPVPPPQIAAAGVPGSTTAHGEDGHEQASGGATDRSEPADTGAGAEPGDGNGNGYSNGRRGDNGGDNEADTSTGADTQFASLTSPAPSAGAPAADTTTADGTAWQQPAASETSDDTSQPVSQEPRDN